MGGLLRWAVAVVLYAALVPAAAHAATNDPLRAQQWGLDMIHADQAHAVTTGAGATVAVVDTGIDASHPDLAGRILPGYDFVDGDATPQDGNGHGTHVSGIVAADANNGIGVDSVAPGAMILPVRVLDNGGSGSDANVASGIDWAVSHGAEVINLSLGGSVPLEPLGVQDQMTAAVQRAVAGGVVVVAAAGNDGLPFCENASLQGKVLCVGAVDRSGSRSFYSSFGQGLSVVAPGGAGTGGADDVLSTWNDGGYHTLAGTSQATPHVSGVAALLVSLGVRGQAAVSRILATATDLGTPGPDPVYGAGLVNAQAAVAGLSRPGGPGGGAGGGGRGRAGVRVSLASRRSIRALLRRGVTITCRAPATGRCSARIAARGVTLARGSARLHANRTVRLRATATPRGRRLLAAELRRRRSLGARVVVRLPGATVRRALLLVG